MDRFKPTTQILGRFQPWHEGHTALFKRGLEKTGQVIILLREQDGTDKNPYDHHERMEMIWKTLVDDEGIDPSVFEIMYMPNITHITYGRDVGYKIEQEHFDKDIEDISATDIRNGLRKENTAEDS